MFGRSKVNRFNDSDFSTPGPGHYNSQKALAEETKGIACVALRSKTARFMKENVSDNITSPEATQTEMKTPLKSMRHNSESSLLLSAAKETAGQMKMDFKDEIQLRKISIDLEESKRKLAIMEKENSFLEKKVATLTKERDGLVKGEREARQRYEREAAKLKKFEKDFDGMVDSISKVKELEKEKHSFHTKLEQMKEEAKLSQATITSLKQQIEEKTEDMRTVKAENAGQIESLSKLLSDANSKFSTLSSLYEERIEDIEEHWGKCREECQNLEQELDTMQKDLLVQRDQNMLLENEIFDVKISNAEILHELEKTKLDKHFFQLIYSDNLKDSCLSYSQGYKIFQEIINLLSDARMHQNNLLSLSMEELEDKMHFDNDCFAIEIEDTNLKLLWILRKAIQRKFQMQKLQEDLSQSNSNVESLTKELKQELSNSAAKSTYYQDEIDFAVKEWEIWQHKSICLEEKVACLQQEVHNLKTENQKLYDDLFEVQLISKEKSQTLVNLEAEKSFQEEIARANLDDERNNCLQQQKIFKEIMQFQQDNLLHTINGMEIAMEENAQDAIFIQNLHCMEVDKLRRQLFKYEEEIDFMQRQSEDQRTENLLLCNELCELDLMLKENSQKMQMLEEEKRFQAYIFKANLDDEKKCNLQQQKGFQDNMEGQSCSLSNQIEQRELALEELAQHTVLIKYDYGIEIRELQFHLLKTLLRRVQAKRQHESEERAQSQQRKDLEHKIASQAKALEQQIANAQSLKDLHGKDLAALQEIQRQKDSKVFLLENQVYELELALNKEKEKAIIFSNELFETKLCLDETCLELQSSICEKIFNEALAEESLKDIAQGMEQCSKISDENLRFQLAALDAQILQLKNHNSNLEFESSWASSFNALELKLLNSLRGYYIRKCLKAESSLEKMDSSMDRDKLDKAEKLASEFRMELEICQEKLKEAEHHSETTMDGLKAQYDQIYKEKTVVENRCTALEREKDKLQRFQHKFQERESEIQEMQQKLMQFANVELDIQSTLEAGEKAQLEFRLAQQALENLIAENAMLAGHQNAKQKIKHLQSMKKENIELHKRAELLEMQVIKLKKQLSAKSL